MPPDTYTMHLPCQFFTTGGSGVLAWPVGRSATVTVTSGVTLRLLSWSAFTAKPVQHHDALALRGSVPNQLRNFRPGQFELCHIDRPGRGPPGELGTDPLTTILAQSIETQ